MKAANAGGNESASLQKYTAGASQAKLQPEAKIDPQNGLMLQRMGRGCRSSQEDLQADLAVMPFPARRSAAMSLQKSLGNRFMQGLAVQAKEEAPPNKTGMPDQLKSGLERLSGIDLSGVRVHYSSSKPAQINALAYTQGHEIHVAPGQERHLPHEAWHAVQQMQGRVRATTQLKDGVPVNDDEDLEHEADVMGGRAVQRQMQEGTPSLERPIVDAKTRPIQMVWQVSEDGTYFNKDNGAIYSSKTRQYRGPINKAWTEKVLDDSLHDKLMQKIHGDLAPSAPVQLDPTVANALRDSSGEFIKAPGIEVHLDVDQLKHQHRSQPIGTREKGDGTKFNPAKYGSVAWHKGLTMAYMRDWALGLQMKDDDKTYHGQAENVEGIHYEGYCLFKDGVKYVLFHCYPDKLDSKYKL